MSACRRWVPPSRPPHQISNGVINAYLLPLSALLLLGGAAGDRFGRVRLLVAGARRCSGSPRWAVLLGAQPAPWLLAGRGLRGRRRRHLDAEQSGDPGRGFFRRSPRPGHRHMGVHGRRGGRCRSRPRRLGNRHGWMARNFPDQSAPGGWARSCWPFCTCAIRGAPMMRRRWTFGRCAGDRQPGPDHLGADNRLGSCRLDACWRSR